LSAGQGVIRRHDSEDLMLYALLCYNSEEVVFSWSQEEDDAVMDQLGKVHARLHDAGQLGPAARLMATTTAATLRKSDPPVVIDGPFTETKEQLLGFYIIDVENLDAALAVAKDLGEANPGGSYEIRPVRLFVPGNLPAELAATEDA
jgi:hypothetical protein